MYENGEQVIRKTIAFSNKKNGKKVFVTIKDHFTWEKVISRAWKSFSELYNMSEEDLRIEFTLSKVQL